MCYCTAALVVVSIYVDLYYGKYEYLTLGSEAEKNQHLENEDDVDVKKLMSQKYVNPVEVRSHVEKVFQRSGDLLRAVFRGSLATEDSNLNSVEMFFMDIIAVPPSRFRPVCIPYSLAIVHTSGL